MSNVCRSVASIIRTLKTRKMIAPNPTSAIRALGVHMPKRQQTFSEKLRELETEVAKRDQLLKECKNEIKTLHSKLVARVMEINGLECRLRVASPGSRAAAKDAEQQQSPNWNKKIDLAQAHLRELQSVLERNNLTITALRNKLGTQRRILRKRLSRKNELLLKRGRELRNLRLQLNTLRAEVDKIRPFYDTETTSALSEPPGASSIEQQSGRGGVASPAINTSPKNDEETVSPELLEQITRELSLAMGSMSALIVRHDIAAMGESMDKFPKTRIVELLDSVTKELPSQKSLSLKQQFAELK